MSWRLVPEAARSVRWRNDSPLKQWWRYIMWKTWPNNRYGLKYQDNISEVRALFRVSTIVLVQIWPEVKEAVRRLSLAEPHKYDERQRRLTRAHVLSINNEILPKEQWTKWEDEDWYLQVSDCGFHYDVQMRSLQKYLNEIEEEKLQRSTSTGLETPYDVYDYQLKQGVSGKGGW